MKNREFTCLPVGREYRTKKVTLYAIHDSGKNIIPLIIISLNEKRN